MPAPTSHPRETSLLFQRRSPSVAATYSSLVPSSFTDRLQSGLTFDSLSVVTTTEVLKLLSSSPTKSSLNDTIRPYVIKICPDVFSELIAKLAQKSFSQEPGLFPSTLQEFRHYSTTSQKPTIRWDSAKCTPLNSKTLCISGRAV